MKLKPWQYWVTKPLITVLFHPIGTQCEEMKWHTTAYPVFCAPVSFCWADFETDRRVQTFSLFNEGEDRSAKLAQIASKRTQHTAIK